MYIPVVISVYEGSIFFILLISSEFLYKQWNSPSLSPVQDRTMNAIFVIYM
jgi:hypothetical protein